VELFTIKQEYSMGLLLYCINAWLLQSIRLHLTATFSHYSCQELIAHAHNKTLSDPSIIQGPGENYRPVASHWQTFSNNVVHLALIEIREITTSVMIGTDCIGHDAPSLQYRILQMR
jgi:hypothetical protein